MYFSLPILYLCLSNLLCRKYLEVFAKLKFPPLLSIFCNAIAYVSYLESQFPTRYDESVIGFSEKKQKTTISWLGKKPLSDSIMNTQIIILRLSTGGLHLQASAY
jgi:hypothetical protein